MPITKKRLTDLLIQYDSTHDAHPSSIFIALRNLRTQEIVGDFDVLKCVVDNPQLNVDPLAILAVAELNILAEIDVPHLPDLEDRQAMVQQLVNSGHFNKEYYHFVSQHLFALKMAEGLAELKKNNLQLPLDKLVKIFKGEKNPANLFYCIMKLHKENALTNKVIDAIASHVDSDGVAQGLVKFLQIRPLKDKNLNFVSNHPKPWSAGYILYQIYSANAQHLLTTKTRKKITLIKSPYDDYDLENGIQYLKDHHCLSARTLLLLLSAHHSASCESVAHAISVIYKKLPKRTVNSVIKNENPSDVAETLMVLEKEHLRTPENEALVLNMKNAYGLFFMVNKLKEAGILDQPNINKLPMISCVKLAFPVGYLCMARMFNQANFDVLLMEKYSWLLEEKADAAFWVHSAVPDIITQDTFDRVLKMIDVAKGQDPTESIREYMIDVARERHPELLNEKYRVKKPASVSAVGLFSVKSGVEEEFYSYPLQRSGGFVI